jgi:hypothetical protein
MYPLHTFRQGKKGWLIEIVAPSAGSKHVVQASADEVYVDYKPGEHYCRRFFHVFLAV